MRIVGGEFRGRALQPPKSDNIRPTTDRVRESLFNVISHNYQENLANARVLDLFAGTGALGIEALSRGAHFALFVENSTEGRGLLRQNIEALALQGRSKIYRRDATKLGELEKLARFDLVFADPPYGRDFGEKAIASAIDGGWLNPGALIVLEEEKASAPGSLPNLEPVDCRTYSDTIIGVYRLAITG